VIALVALGVKAACVISKPRDAVSHMKGESFAEGKKASADPSLSVLVMVTGNKVVFTALL
jgi:hypothetical protein